MQGGYQSLLVLEDGINFFCLCNLRKESPTTRVFLFNDEKKLKVIATEKYKHISIVKLKAGGSKIANDIDDTMDCTWSTPVNDRDDRYQHQHQHSRRQC
jgi:hypothetical protein